MRVHHGGKNGDLVYALPVIKALARQRNERVTLITSALCFGLVPLLWEQPYIKDVEIDYARAYETRDGSIIPWDVLRADEGINLSPQPAMYRPNAPVSWTAAYMEIAGVTELLPRDKVALPTLWNRRQWYWEHELKQEGRPAWKPPRTVVLAPESQTLKTNPLWCWREVAEKLVKEAAVFVVGEKPSNDFRGLPVNDLRGMTTVSSVACLLAEATLVISSNSLPWHLARHAGTPTFCFQDQYLERCIPIDTPYVFYTSEKRAGMIDDALAILEKPRTTLLSAKDLKRLEAA